MKKVAIVGLGKMGLLHASLLNTLPDVKLTALCEKSFLVRKFGGRVLNGVKMAKGIGELADLGLDMVYVTTPPSTHYAVLKEVYFKQIARNVFVEKPLTMSCAESKELCGLAQKRGANMVGYNRRFSVTFGKAKEILDSDALGKLSRFEGYAYSSDLCGVDKPPEVMLKGGILRDLGCHIIDIAHWLFGQLEVETAYIEPTYGDVYFSVKASGGLTGEFRNSWRMKDFRLPEVGLWVEGAKGGLSVDEDKAELALHNGEYFLWRRHDLGDNVPFFLGGAEYFREDEAFVRAVSDGNGVEPDFQTALEVDRLIEEVERKAER